MDQIEQETPRDGPAIEVTDLPSTAGERNVVGTLPGGQVSRCIEGPPLAGARPASIWRNWPLITAGGILLLLIIIALPILTSILKQSSQHHPSAPAIAHTTPTPAPILSPLSGSHSVYPTAANGVVYIGASDGAVTAVRVSDGQQLWQYKTSGGVYAP